MPSDDTNPRAGRKAKSAFTATNNDGGLYEAFQRFWQKSYAGDYLGLALLVTAMVFVQLLGEPFHKQFKLSDTRIQHPHAEVERVDVVWLIIYAAGVPAAALAVWFVVLRVELHKVHVTFLGLAISIITAIFLTDIFKDAVGRPRPDLIARCKPEPGTPVDELVTFEVCTETNHHVLHDGWRSYPSGHSSFAFAGLGWLALFFASQMHSIRPRASLTTMLITLTPLVGAALIAISRLEDYRHDVGDVVTGSALGFTVAYFNWRRYYPNLFASDCHEPHSPPRSGRSSPSGAFQRVRDEEEGFARGSPRRYSIAEEGERYGAVSTQR